MLYFTLPCFFENFAVNNLFIELSKMKASYFIEPVTFIQTSGNFPYCSWNGSYNSNLGEGAFYDAFQECFRKNEVPLRIDCSNIYLEENDYYDSMGQAILKANHNGSNLLSVANLEFMEQILNDYPNFKFVFSRNADLLTSFTPELLNKIIATEQFQLIEIPVKYNTNFNFLQQIKQKNKIELMVNPMCPLNCKEYHNCLINNNLKQIEYSSYDVIENCQKHYPINAQKRMITLEQIKKQYIPLGINHFTFSPYRQDSLSFLFYLYYFIKPEHQMEVSELWLLRLQEIMSQKGQNNA